MQAFFLLFSPQLERRPNPITLKLVSSHKQYFPKQERVQEAVAHQIQWLWLRDMICPFDFARTQNLVVQSVDPAQQLLPRLNHLQTFEFASLLSDQPEMIETFIDLILHLPQTVHTFIFSGNLRISYYDFCRLLLALGQCRQLRKLTLPSPKLTGREPSAQVLRSFGVLSPRVAHRPKLTFLQLVTHHDRGSPSPITSSSGSRDCEWQWLEDELCPFALHYCQELVVGGAKAAQRILPIVQNHLTHLEFCSYLDTQKSWTAYEERQHAPIVMPRLTFIKFVTYTYMSTWALDIIKAPMIKTIVGQWTARVPPFYLQDMFRKLDERAAKLNPAEIYPPHLEVIQLFAPVSESVKPNTTWFRSVFPIASGEEVRILVDYI
ncbi:hypothetical protein GYMLUDRAFT_252627 [Collybiopsis luxurians FD-317 M1]|uniref:Uncharacterized protein n=1 Tax=Collybiopsis luxurians FD-317 M1 TaxID=944289 RepID=A0A0D0BMW0_9AGAR|nr:hypothetical protein GYMLUDRAFT_252627 [Collybiopsis luxurians FD-317 M1]